jgi:hypothetical protein
MLWKLDVGWTLFYFSAQPIAPGKRYDLVGDGRSTQQPTLQKAFH